MRNSLLFALDSGEWRACAGRETIDLPAGRTLRFNLASGGHWFGHGFAHRQPWPLQVEPIVNNHFAVNNCQCPAWLCSAGVAILVDTNEELAVGINAGGDGQLRIRCDPADVAVRLFAGLNLPEANRQLLAYLDWPNVPPEPSVFADAIFCTWTQFPRTINQRRILGMARSIRENGYPCSAITIDDRWESAYGELEFSADFPDPAGMVRQLHALGFRVLLWVTPFVNREAKTFDDLARRGVLVRSTDNDSAPAMLKWWGGQAGLVDLTAPAGRDWFVSRLQHLQRDIGIDGFKIDGGDAKYQPSRVGSRWAADPGPSGYSDKLLAVFEQFAPGLCETRTMWRSQGRRILWRQGGKDSHFRIDNGLAAMVRLGLNMAVLGYDVQIPDMIPGRVQTMNQADPLPTDELMVRWTEASAFWPIMQFSYLPWNYGEPTASAVRGLALAHHAIGWYIADSAAADRPAPLIRPMWFDSPGIEDFYTIGDQFMLGADLLVAPVLSEGATTRDVLLPPGRWRDAWTGEIKTGRVGDYPAPCPGLPLFVREAGEDSDSLFDALHSVLRTIPRGTIRPGVTTTTYEAGINRDLSVTG